MVPFHEVIDFQNSRNISTIIPIFHFLDLPLYTQQETDDYLGSLHLSDLDFFALQRPKNLAATQSTPNSSTNLVNTLYSNLRNNTDTPPPKLCQSLPAQIPVS